MNRDFDTVVADHEIPSELELLDKMEKFHLFSTPRKFQENIRNSKSEIKVGPLASREELESRVINSSMKIAKSDLLIGTNAYRGNVRATTAKILQHIVPNCARAIRRPNIVSFRNTAMIVSYSSDVPNREKPHSNSGILMEIGVKQTGTFVIKRKAENNDYVPDCQDEEGTPVIRSQHHATQNCACVLPASNNNFESLLYSSICIPREAVSPYVESDKLPTGFNMKLAGESMLNPSMVMAGEITRCGSVLAKLLQRQPLSCIERSELRYYEQPFHGVNFRKTSNEDLLKSVLSQANSGGYRNYTMKMSDTNTECKGLHMCRFSKDKPLRKTGDYGLQAHEIEYYGGMSMEEILSNSVHVGMFHGRYACNYCDDSVTSKSVRDLVHHLISAHRDLRDCVFTCPTCLTTTVVDFDDFMTHYEEHHAATASFAVVLNETNPSRRACWGIALAAYFETLDLIDPDNLLINTVRTVSGNLSPEQSSSQQIRVEEGEQGNSEQEGETEKQLEKETEKMSVDEPRAEITHNPDWNKVKEYVSVLGGYEYKVKIALSDKMSDKARADALRTLEAEQRLNLKMKVLEMQSYFLPSSMAHTHTKKEKKTKNMKKPRKERLSSEEEDDQESWTTPVKKQRINKKSDRQEKNEARRNPMHLAGGKSLPKQDSVTMTREEYEKIMMRTREPLTTAQVVAGTKKIPAVPQPMGNQSLAGRSFTSELQSLEKACKAEIKLEKQRIQKRKEEKMSQEEYSTDSDETSQNSETE